MRQNGKDFNTLVELLRLRAAQTPSALAYTYLKDGIHEDQVFTYATLDQAARAIAVSLSRCEPHLQPGDRVLLLYPAGLEFIAAFFGCLYAGLVPIPAPPPDVARFKRTFPRLKTIIEDAGARLVLATDGIVQTAQAVGVDGTPWVCSDQIDFSLADAWAAPLVSAGDLAYLQYTSGSTSSPKGVMLTHECVLRNLELSQVSWAYTPESVAVTWMPYFHDYGLVDGLLQPLYTGIPCYVLSPLTFIKRPQRWLEAIQRYRGTHTQAPNFAYELCLEKITVAQRDVLDLRSLKVASNGAEPLRLATYERFIEYFSPCGFAPQSYCPAYGLAEATLLVTTKRDGELLKVLHADATVLEREQRFVPVQADQADAKVRGMVSCGIPLGDLKLAIVDAQSRKRCRDGEIGEVWVNDPCVAIGYWDKPEDSAQVFGVQMIDEPEAGGFLRTGDLGFMHDGELYVTGRLKDLIIVAGVNHYPQDIEWTIQQSHPEFRPEHCAAFSVEVNGEEQLVAVAELNNPQDDYTPLFDAVRRAVSDTHELHIHAFVALRKGGIFKTSSGKLQRRQCRAAFLDGTLSTLAQWRHGDANKEEAASTATTSTGNGNTADRERIAHWLIDRLAACLDIPAAGIDPAKPFATYGLTSRIGVTLVGDLEQWLKIEDLSPTLLWEYPTVVALSSHLSNSAPGLGIAVTSQKSVDGPVAIIGMACRLPGAANPQQLWQLLIGKGEAISTLPAGRWEGSGAAVAEGVGPGHVTTLRAGFLSAVDRFDADLFGIGAREAEIMDPQQRLLLEVAWETFEEAGQNIDALAGSNTGVFVGISTDDYSAWQFGDTDKISAYTGPAKALSIAANRISYQFDLLGPSMAIDTACSSSLVAIHQASQALRRGECGMALAGGVNLILAPQMSIALSQAGMLAPDGRCKTFDAAADGYVRGEGCVLFLLKRLDDALRDGDAIHAVIRGSAINQDGRSNGLTAPNGLAQQRVVRQALAAAGVRGADIAYVETHGTGTALGDPIEVKSLQAVLAEDRASNARCALGAIKTNIGHLEAAAGAAGLLKAVLCMKHGKLAPHPTLRQVNPLLNLESSAFYIPTEPVSWPAGARLAGISAFGFGGSNAHLILEAAAEVVRTNSVPPVITERPLHVLTLNARDQAGLRALASSWQQLDVEDSNVGDLCFSANTTRVRLPERLAVSGVDATALKAALDDWQHGRPGDWHNGAVSAQRAPRIGFLFSGQGSQYIGMGRELYATQPEFRANIDACAAVFRDITGEDLPSLLYGEANESTEAALARTDLTQPALFALEYALARLWIRWGITPSVLLGHSVGEYVAAAIAGVFTAEEGMRLVTARARLMHGAPGDGAMVAVVADEGQCRAAIGELSEKVVIAVYNGPRNHVLSGERAALDVVVSRLIAQGVDTRPLHVSHAFHSPLMQAAAADLGRAAAMVSFQSPSIPVISNVSGVLAGAEITTPDYWVAHLLSPVRFAQGLHAMRDAGVDVFIEIGPRVSLLALGQQSIEDAGLLWLPSLRPQYADTRLMLDSLAALHVRGAAIDWHSFDSPWLRKRVPVPSYPFQGRAYWLPPVVAQAILKADSQGGMLFPGKRIASPLLQHVLFENRYNSDSLLAEHKVFGQVVVPGAAHLSLILEAAASVLNDQPCAIQDVMFPQALVIPDNGARRIQLSIERQAGKDGRQVRLISLNDGDDETFEEHAYAHLIAAEGITTTPLSEVQARCAEALQTDFYRDVWQPAIDLGPQFRWVDKVWRGNEQVLARLVAPSQADAGYRLHPGLIDSMLQILTAATNIEAGEALVPFSFEQFSWLSPLQGQVLWSHIVLRPVQGSANEVVSDVTLYDGEGRLIAQARGFCARRVASRSLIRAKANPLDDAVYGLRWDILAANAGSINGVCLIVGAVAADVALLSQAINADGRDVICEQLVINLDASDAAAVLAQRLAQTTSAVGTVIYLAASTVAAPSNTDAVNACGRLLTLVQAMAGSGKSGMQPRLVVVTNNAQGIESSDAVRVDQAAVWGMTRVLRLEHPELACHCVDLGELSNHVSDAVVASAILQVPTDVAVRGNRLLSPTLTTRRPKATTSPVLRVDAVYVISGGLGALGLRLAEWLVEQGARHLVLLGRRTAGDVATATIADLRQRDVTVHVHAVDIANASALSAVLQAYPIIGGVFHLAGVLDDAVLLQQDRTRLHGVLAPKLGGALNLHHALKNHTLDYFVCFSSVAALTGSMGQSTYAAANAALDGLMAWRRTNGLPGRSIQWGPWAEAGMAAVQSARDRQRFAGYGIEPIDPAQGFALLGKLLAGSEETTAVLAVQWPTYLQQLYAGTSFPAMYAELHTRLTQQQAVVQPAANNNLAERLQKATAPERRKLLEQALQEVIAGVLGAGGQNTIGPRQRLFDLGLDSLGAVELRNRLAAKLGRNLRTTLLFDFPTLIALADHIERDVLGFTAVDQTVASADIVAEDLEQFSDDELARLLAAELE